MRRPRAGGPVDLVGHRRGALEERIAGVAESTLLLLRTDQPFPFAESEQVGATTLETMGRQREQMERSSGLVRAAMEDTAEARKILKEMALRAFKNKMVLYCVIALLVAANGGMLVHLWRRKK